MKLHAKSAALDVREVRQAVHVPANCHAGPFTE